VTARAVFLWHLHQPEYRDPQTGQPLLPWVRLHSTRAYTDMAAALEKHEPVRAVVNWAPSLLLQLEAYASGAAVDLDEQIARKPVESLTPGERMHVLRQSFSVAWERWVKPVPRYAELLRKRGTDLKAIDLASVHGHFTEQELRDLEVHFLLAWMGFAARREEPIARELLQRERGFGEQEKLELLAAQRRVASRILPRWRALAARGQVEITCSPLFHPILPLLVDTESALRAMPHARLPPRFQHPEDAREQVRRGLDVAERVFGQRPVGMWPSEGSVSPEVLEVLASCGVRWFATDEGVLARSELSPESPAPMHGLPAHHRAYGAGPQGQLVGLFRDREISDAVGFRYAHGPAAAGAQDLVRRLSTEPRAPEADGERLVTVALDGENPWEHYEGSGEAFLDELYARLSAPDAPVRCVLPRDELLPEPPRARLSRIHSGSWIDACYRIWIGHPEDNEAWALLGEARRALDEHAGAVGPEAAERARAALFAAEGSDWFWWYGDDFQTENAPEFDALFRRWVAAAYRALRLPPPDRLGLPIIGPHKDAAAAAALIVQPRRLIEPLIDGFHYGYYEWAGAGLYRPEQQGASMYRGPSAFSQMLWGFSLEALYVRLDPMPGTELGGSVQLFLTSNAGSSGPPPHRHERKIVMELRPGGAESQALDERGQRCGRGRTGAIVELALDLAALGLSSGDELGLWLRVLRDDVELDRLPRYGELHSVIPDRGFEGRNWQV
jgi:alpha-amylase/alpha-mannosidase (GH57 family)